MFNNIYGSSITLRAIFTFLSQILVLPGQYASWAYNQPDNTNGVSFCAVSDTQTTNYSFAGTDCSDVCHFLCDLRMYNSHVTYVYVDESFPRKKILRLQLVCRFLQLHEFA